MKDNIKFQHPFIQNSVELYPKEKYTAILGINPSLGARSPYLWNASFEYFKIDSKMYAFDVQEDKLNDLLAYLDNSPNFLGGAIAVPYKEKVAEWLGERVSNEALKIGAVNCLARSIDGQLWGHNTDGLAALEAFKLNFPIRANKSILILGSGGSAKAVSAYFKNYLEANDRLTMASRSLDGKLYANKLGVSWIEWEKVSSFLHEVNILINCTSVGHGELKDKSPLKLEDLTLMPSNSIVYDIIYQPSPSLLLKHALDLQFSILDGTHMNLKQAVIAFSYVNRINNVTEEKVEISMSNYLNGQKK